MRALAFGLMMVAGSVVSAQNGGDILYSNLDSPSESQTLSRSALALHGWAFNCSKGGQQPFDVKVRVFTSNGVTVVPVRRYSALYRPDVRAAFLGTCTEMSSYTGFALVPLDWASLPVGTVTLVVEWADSNGASYSQRRITLTP